MVRVSHFWNLRVKLVALLGCLLAGTLTAQSWLHGASERKLLTAIEEVAGEIATEAVEMMMKATAAVPTQPKSVTVVFRANTRRAGNKQLVPDEQTGRLLRQMQQALQVRTTLGSADQWNETLLRIPLNDLVRAMISRNYPDLDVEQALAFYEQDQEQDQKSINYAYGLNNSRYGGRAVPETKIAADALPLGQDSAVQNNELALGTTFDEENATVVEERESSMEFGAGASELPRETLIVRGNAAPVSASRNRNVEVSGSVRKSFEDSTLVYEKKKEAQTPAAVASNTASGDPLSNGIEIQPHLDRLQNLVREARKSDLQATVGVFLLGVVLAWLLGTRLVRPVTEVVEGMRVVASGDLAMRLPERDDPEFGLVSHQFNDMVERLEAARRIERGLEHRERVQTMGDLAAGVAHDIRNPLSAISLHVGRIRREFEPESPEAREKFLNYTGDVKEEIERLNGLVSNFLQLAQPASHEVEAVAPGELLKDVHRLLEKEAAAHQVQLEIKIQEDLCDASWNRIEAKSAFVNVAMNAIQAMDGVGGTLRMIASSDQQWVVISFVDDGPGISEENQEKVMLPYVTMRPGGTGLGLAIARRVAERHGGRLELSSEVGVGTEVRFLMPAKESEAAR